MPAPSSCASSLSTLMPSTPASCLMVTSDMIFAFSLGEHTRVATRSRLLRRARGQDQLGGALLVDAFDRQLHQLVGGEVRQVLAGDDVVLGQLVGNGLVHALDRKSVV